jgi:ABC-type Na+ efflux pump permease subunit
MNLAIAVTRREIREVLRDFNLLMPMIALPALIALIAAMAIVGSSRGPANFLGQAVGGALLDQVPENQLRLLVYLDVRDQDTMIRVVLKALMIPLFWVTPVALTSTIAADSFVGEKERGTIEPLLATPIRSAELFGGKLLATIIPAILGTWLGTGLYALLAAASRSPYYPPFLLADQDWLFSSLVLAPLTAILAASAGALISTRVSSYRVAYQLNSLIVLPVVLVLVPQAVLLFLVTPLAFVYVAGLLAVIDVLLLVWALRIFDRERLLGR